MTNKICKIIPWEDRQDLLDILDTRADATVMKSSHKINPSLIENDINRLDIYDHNLVVGLYEDGILDCFIYVYIWSEPRTYSQMFVSRRKENREKYNDHTKHDKNMVELYNFQLQVMESRKYYNLYAMIQNVDWVPYFENPNCLLNRYRRSIIEDIEPNKLSSYPLLRQKLSSRIFNSPTRIVFLSLPFELRNNA